MTDAAESVASRLTSVRERMRAAAMRVGRSPDEVRLVAVSKTFPTDRVLEGLSAGLDCFGENRVQEAARKIPAVAAATNSAPPTWHLVGALQRNKARRAVELFDLIQSLDRPELARALDRAAAGLGERLEVFLQINIDEEAQKAGVLPSEARELLDTVDACPNLRPAGLMAIPQPSPEPEEMRPSFARLRALSQELDRGRAEGERLRELSMGMSADFEIAIEEGATWVRLGTALFGERGT